jgi:hypothetical protein
VKQAEIIIVQLRLQEKEYLFDSCFLKRMVEDVVHGYIPIDSIDYSLISINQISSIKDKLMFLQM